MGSVLGEASLYVSETPCVFGGSSTSFENSFAVVVGAPMDITTSYRPGTRFAPCSIRMAAANIEFYSMRFRVDVEKIPIHDLGDIVIGYDVGEAVRRVRDVVGEVVGRGKLLVLLGGEHTVTLGSIQAVSKKYSDACMIVADAHLDLRAEYMGSKLNHATFMRRIVEDVGTPIAYVGVRAVSGEEVEYAREKNLTMFTSYEVEREGPDVIGAELSRFLVDAGCNSLYVSIDLDVLDPAYAPGVSNPEAEGLTTMQLLDLLASAISSSGVKLVGFDIVELSPHYDIGGATSITAAKIAVELIAAGWRSWGRG